MHISLDITAEADQHHGLILSGYSAKGSHGVCPGDALCGSERMFDLISFRDDLGSLWFATNGACDRFLHRAIIVVLNFLSSVASQ